MIKAQAILMASACSLAPALCSQQMITGPTINLKPSNKIELSLSRSTETAYSMKCDQAGNVYARFFDVSTVGNPSAAPIQQITPQGKLAQSFQFSRAGEVIPTRGMFVTADGNVYVLYGGPQPGAVQFAKDGAVKSRTTLLTGVDIDPWHVAVFPSGGFLVAGTTGKEGRTPYTAVFDANGKLLKRIHEPEDEEARTKGEIGDIEFTYNRSWGNVFAEEGDVTVGSDGNAYLLHGTSPAWVYVISPSGAVIRKLQMDADDDHNFRSIVSDGGRLAMGFAGFGQTIIQVMDLKGNPAGRYTIAGAEGDLLDLACYDSSGFTFVTGDADTKPYVVKASAP